MKSKTKLFLSAGLLLPVFVFAPVMAVTGQDSTQTLPNTSTTVAHTEAETKSEEDSDASTRAERLAKRKAELKTKLDAVKQARIKNKCKASQGNLSSIRGRIKGLETSRSHVYENLVNRLTKTSQKLKDKGLDTAELDTQITELNTLIATFNTDLAAYKLAVGDLAEMDCVAEPIAFQASLEAARLARTKTADDAKAIRTYLADTIKPTLKTLRSLVEKESETESGGTQ